MNARQSVALMQAMTVARSSQIPFEFFDAVALSEDEAGKVCLDVNAERLMDAVMAQPARGSHG